VSAFQDLLAGGVHVWRASLRAGDETVVRLRTLLSADELHRGETFRSHRHQREFIVHRGILRQILSSYSGQRPAHLQFELSPYGKPRLSGGAGIEFNLSHSGDGVVYAVAHRRRVGVDIEWLRPMPDALELARHFFSPEEHAKLCAMPEADRTLAFLTCWTRKEAYVKARAVGLALDLHRFCLSVPPDAPVLLYSDEPPADRRRWTFADLALGDAHVGCLAVEGPAPALVVRDWTP
jgi:4'-phosphopantetheinyl transferase